MRVLAALALCVALAAAAAGERTLFADLIEAASGPYVSIPEMHSDRVFVDQLTSGKLTLQPDGDMRINTGEGGGPAALAGNTVTLSTQSEMTWSAADAAGLAAFTDLHLAGGSLQVSATESIVFNADVERNFVDANVFSVYADSFIQSSNAGVEVGSSAGSVSIYADDLFELSSRDTVIAGDNGVSLHSTHHITVEATRSVRSESNVVDFDAAGDFTIDVSAGTLSLAAGARMLVEGVDVLLSGNAGVELTSDESSVLMESSLGISMNTAGSINIAAVDDAIFNSLGSINLNSETAEVSSDAALFIQANSFTMVSVVGTVTGPKVELGGTGTVITGNSTDAAAGDTLGASGFQASINATTSAVFDSDLTQFVDALYEIILGEDAEGELGIDVDTSLTTVAGKITIDDLDSPPQLSSNGDIVFSATQTRESELDWEAKNDFQATATQGHAVEGGFGSMGANLITMLYNHTALFNSLNNLNVQVSNFEAESVEQSKWLSVDPHGGIRLTDEPTYFGEDGSAGIVMEAADSIEFQTYTSDDIYLNFQLIHFDSEESDASHFVSTGGVHTVTTPLFESQEDIELLVQSTDYDVRVHQVKVFDLLVPGTWSFAAGEDVELGSDGTTDITGLDLMNVIASGEAVHHSELRVEHRAGTSMLFHAGGDVSVYSGVDNVISVGAVDLTMSDVTLTLDAANDLTVHTAGDVQMVAEFELEVTADVGRVDVFTDEYKDVWLLANDMTSTANRTLSFMSSEGEVRFDAAAGILALTERAELTATDTIDLECADGDNCDVLLGGEDDLRLSSAGNIVLEIDRDLLMSAPVATNFWTDRDLSLSSGLDSFFNGNVSLDAPVVRLASIGQTIDDFVDVDTLVNGTLTFDAGRFEQSKGGFHLLSDGVEMRAHENIYLSAVRSLLLESISENITMEAFGSAQEPGTIRWRADDLDVNGDSDREPLGVDVYGATIRIDSKEGDDIEFISALNILTTSNNGKDITSFGAGDRIGIGGAVELDAAGSVVGPYGDNEAIVFESTEESADTVVLARNGYLTVTARDTISFTSQGSSLAPENGKIFATDDIIFSTKADAGVTGGINVQVHGTRDSDLYDADVGAVFRSQASDIDVLLYSELQQVYLRGLRAARVSSADGVVRFDAGSDIDFTSVNGDVQVDAPEGYVQAITDIGDITFSSGKDVDVQASNRLSIVASDTITLESTDAAITDPDGLAFEFASDASHVAVDATGTGSFVKWEAADDATIQSGLGTAFTAITGTRIETALGVLSFAGESGTTFNVTDGETTVSGTGNVAIESGRAARVFIDSGLALEEEAGGRFGLAAAEGADIRTTGGDVRFETEAANGDISILAEGFIGFQADGTDNSVGTGGVDGIFVRGQNVDLAARDAQLWEIEQQLVIGASSRPQVQMESGGDGDYPGFVWSSEGSTQIVSQRSFDVDASYQAWFVAQSNAKFEAVKNIEVTTTGTSAFGKTIDVSAGQALDVDALNVLVRSELEGEISSERNVRLEVVGDSFVQNYVKIDSANVFKVDARYWNGDVGSWTGRTGTLDVEAVSDVLLSTTRGGTGDVSLLGDSLLLFESDLNMQTRSVGTGATVTLRSTSPNSPVSFSTDAASSAVRLASDGDIIGVAETDVIVTGESGVSITSFDNSLAGDSGDVSFDTFGDLEFESDNGLALGGARGVLFETVAGGSKDIEISTFGGAARFSSREDMEINANGGDFTMTSSADLRLGTTPLSRGSLLLESATSLDFLGNSDVLLSSGDDFTVEAGSALIIEPIAGASPDDALYLSTSGDDALLSVQSAAGDIVVTVDDTEFLSDGLVFEAYGDMELLAVDDMDIVTDTDRGITLSAGAATGDQANSLVIEGKTGDVNFAADGTTTQEGFVNVESGGVLTMAAESSWQMTAARGRVRSTVGGEFDLDVTGNLVVLAIGNDERDRSVHVRVSEPDATLGFDISGTVSFNAASQFQVQSTDETDVGGVLAMEATNTLNFNAAEVLVLEARSPHADVLLRSTDFIDGDIVIDTTEFDAIGHEGFVVQTVDDDDLDTEPTFDVRSTYTAVVGSGGDVDPATGEVVGVVIETSRDAAIVVDAGADVEVRSSDNVEIYADGLVSLDTTDLSFSNANGFELSAERNLTLNAADMDWRTLQGLLVEGGDVSLTAGLGGINIQAGSSSVASEVSRGSILVEARGPIRFTGQTALGTARSRPIDVTIESILRIPFLFPRDGADALSPVATGDQCRDQGTNSVATWMGGPRSFWYDPIIQRICYCVPGLVGGSIACY